MTEVYHITHLNNLRGILAKNSLVCVAALRARPSRDYVDIAHGHIQDRRSRKTVPCGRGGALDEYVPFYFAPRPPMLYAISRGAVQGYTEGQNPIVYLVAIAESISNAGVKFVFTDGHALIEISRFFHDLSALDKVDWQVMRARYWRDTREDGDRKRRRQAEFLVYKFLPWPLITEVAVRTRSVARKVEEMLQNAAHHPLVSIRRKWYYG